MGPRERREREREEVRTKILDTARELFAREGVESVTMRRIAEGIEYSPTAIYFHFRDKETLLSELCAKDFRDFAGRFAEAGRIADPLERLRASGRAYADFGLEYPSHYRVMFMTPKTHRSHDLDKGNPEEDAYAFLKGTIEDAIRQDRLRPELTDPDLVAQIVWAGVHGVISLEIAKCTDEWVEWRPVAERAKLMIDVLIAGLEAR